MEFAHKLFSTRGGTLLLAWLAAAIAGIAVFAYVRNYRQSVKTGGQPATVLVAKSLIPKGTPGELIATQQLFQAQTMRESQLREGALSDPSALTSRVTAADIYPGQQLVSSAFVAASTTLASKLVAKERGITIPIDGAHGMIGQVKAGDRIDAYAGFNVTPVNGAGQPLSNAGQSRPVLRLIVADVPVISVNRTGSGSTRVASSVTLKTTSAESEKLAFASDFGKVWFALRPAAGAKPSSLDIVTIETELLGVPPIVMLRSLGGRS
jgi:pilus assembly protein CpaB